MAVNPFEALRAADPIEILAAIAGLINIVLLVRRNIWNYPFGIASVALLLPVFYGAKLYSDAALQLFYIVVQLYGWRAWARAGEGEAIVRVDFLSSRARLIWAGAIAALALLWGAGMQHWTDAAYPFWDALIVAMSVAAQILLARRRIENWWLWIAVDVIALALYPARGLWIAAGLYAVYLLLSIVGLRAWMAARAS